MKQGFPRLNTQHFRHQACHLGAAIRGPASAGHHLWRWTFHVKQGLTADLRGRSCCAQRRLVERIYARPWIRQGNHLSFF